MGVAFALMLLWTNLTYTTALLFVARASINGAFTVSYLMTPELYPTNIRTTASGIANSFSRLGGMLCPFGK